MRLQACVVMTAFSCAMGRRRVCRWTAARAASFLANVELVDLRFIPDHPLETRLLSRWRILTKGAARGRCGRTAVFLIDGSLFEQHRTPASKEQAETQAVRGSGNGSETASSTRFIGSSF